MGVQSATDAWLTSATLTAAVGIAITVGLFWWLNIRRGRLKSFEPHTFSFGMTKSESVAGNRPILVLRLPLILYNDGAVPNHCQNIRLRFVGEPNAFVPLPWMASLSRTKPEPNEPRDFPTVFSVAGRTAQQLFIEFGRPPLGFMLEARDYQIRIEVKVGHKNGWQHLLTFPLHAQVITSPGQYITYENTVPGD